MATNPNLAEDIAKYLAALSVPLVAYSDLVASSAWPVFIDKIPQTPDAVVAIFNYAGEAPDGKLGYDSPRFQVRVRSSTDPVVAQQEAAAIYDALHGLGTHGALTLPLGTVLLSCEAIASPQTLGQDTNNRHEYVVNFKAEVRNTAGGRQ